MPTNHPPSSSPSLAPTGAPQAAQAAPAVPPAGCTLPALRTPGDGSPAALATLARPAAVYLARVAAGSRPAVRDSLRRLLDTAAPGVPIDSFPWALLRYEHTQALRAAMATRYAPRTANKHLSVLRGVLREAWKLGHLTAEELERTLAFDGVKGDTPEVGRMLSRDDLARLFATCGAGPLGARDAAILAVALFGGLRRAEIAGLDLADVEGAALAVLGKRRKYRKVPVPAQAVEFIDRWLVVRGRAAGPLFTPIRRGGHLVASQRLSTAGVWKILREAVDRAGIAHAAPHDFRRTFISTLLSKVDAKTVKDLAGHARVDTTMGYDRRDDVRKREAATTLANLVALPMPDVCTCGAPFIREPAKDPFQWQCDRCTFDRAAKYQRQQAGRLPPDQLDRALDEARRAGVPATLTMHTWLSTVRAFDGLCAYCGEADYEVIEHATPLPRGGTVAANCLPACTACDSRKGDRDLATWAREAPSPRLDAAHAYLEDRKVIHTLDNGECHDM